MSGKSKVFLKIAWKI